MTVGTRAASSGSTFQGYSLLIQLPTRDASGTARQRFGLERLVDLSRLLPAESGVSGVVRLSIDQRAPAPQLSAIPAGGAAWTESDGTIGVAPALLDLVTDIVSADAEQRSTLKDKHGRVPPGENALVRVGLDRELVLQQLAAALRAAVLRVAGARPVRLVAPWPDGHRWAVGLSHDLDVVAFWPLFTGLRTVELFRHAAFGRLARSWISAIGSAFSDPVVDGVAALLAQENAAQVPSTWFVLCGTPTLATFTAGDLTYRPESLRARALFRMIAADHHEIALHGSFETSQRPTAFAEQRSRLAVLTGAAATGVRQHFVRLRPGSTHLSMAQTGFSYDATMGFSDRNGFRLGVADVVPGWNSAEQGAIDLDLVPFAWMDRALSKHGGVEEPERWIADGLLLADRCRAAEGLWAGIWHPNLVPSMGFPGAPDANAQLMRRLKAGNPWFATHRDLAAWRRVRRAAVAVAIDGAGKVTAHTRTGGPAPLYLESYDGTRLEPVELPR